MRERTLLLLILMAVTSIPALLFLVGAPAHLASLARRPWFVPTLLGVVGVVGLGVLMRLLGAHVVCHTTRWRRRRHPLPYTRQQVRTVIAARNTRAQEANAAVIARLAAQGHTLPGLTTNDPALSILIFLRGCGRDGATAAQIHESTGIAVPVRDATLQSLLAQDRVAHDGMTYRITERGAATIAHL
jgi:hypothetical protein